MIEYLKPSPSANPELGKILQSVDKSAPKPSQTSSPASSDTVDKLSISSEARGLQHTEQVVRAELNSIPDVRLDKIRAAREKILSGFYNSEKGISAAADSLLDTKLTAEVKETADVDALLNKIDKKTNVRQENIDLAKERNEAGYYNREDTLKTTADKLWIPPLYRS